MSGCNLSARCNPGAAAIYPFSIEWHAEQDLGPRGASNDTIWFTTIAVEVCNSVPSDPIFILSSFSGEGTRPRMRRVTISISRSRLE